MTAISPIVLPSSRISSDPSAADTANTAAPAARTDFAGTLQGVTAKSARKPPAGKDAPVSTGGGQSLPQPGKPVPASPAAAPQTPPAPQSVSAAPNPLATQDVPVVAAPVKGKQPLKTPAVPAPPAGTPNPLTVSVVPATPVIDTKGSADAKSQAPSLPSIAISGGGGAPLASVVTDATLGGAPGAAPGQAPDAKPAAEHAGDNTAPLVNQGSPDAAGVSAAIPAPLALTTAAAATQQPPASPAGTPSTPASPSQAAAAPSSAPPSAAASTATATPANLTTHAGQVAAVHATTGPKGTTASSAKVRAPSATETRHAEAGQTTQPEEGDGAGAHPRQTVVGTSSATGNGVGIDTRRSGGGEATPVSALAMNAKGPDAAPDNEAVSGDAVPDVHAAGSAGVASNNAPSTPSFANLVGEAIDKHAASKPDASGSVSVDPNGALQSVSQAGAGNAPDAQAAGPTFKLGPSVDSSEFGQGVANQVSMMVDSNITNAKLQVSPPALGPIEVRIALQGDHASVQFTSHSAVTREALADSTPKLRDMLTAQGFGQVSVDISHRSFQERPSNAQAYEWGGKRDAAEAAPSAAVTSLPAARVARSALDAYA